MANNKFVSLSLLKDQIRSEQEKNQSDRISQSLAAASAAKQAAHNAALIANHDAKRSRPQSASLGGEVVGASTELPASVRATISKKQADTAKQEYESYKDSEEARKNQQEANRRALMAEIEKVFATPGVSNSDRVVTRQDIYASVDPKALELKARADYYQGQATAAQNEAITEKNLQELESWSEEDRSNLERYIIEQDMAQSNIFGEPQFDTYNLNPLIGKYGYNKVREMAESLRWSQSQKAAEDTTQFAKEIAEEHPVLGSVASAVTSLVGAVTAPVEYAKEMSRRTGQYSTMNPNNVGTLPNTFGGNVRQTVTENIQGDGSSIMRNLAAIGYQGGMSIIDNSLRLLASGGNAGISAAIAASGTFGQGLQQYSAQGATPAQAATLAFVDAGLEYMTEKISDAKMLEFYKGGTKRDLIKNALWQTFGVEPLSEEVNLFAGIAAEAAILGKNAATNQKIGELVAGGMSYEEASAEVWKGIWQEAKQTYAVSAISAGGQTAATTLAGNVARDLRLKMAEREAAQQPTAVQEVQQEQPSISPEQRVANAVAAVLGGQTDDTTSVNTNPEAHTPQEQAVIDAYQNSVNGANVNGILDSVPTMDTSEQSTEGGQLPRGTGAAERGFTPKQALINQYGNIPEGENPVRPDQLPASTTGEDRVSRTARTVMEAQVTPDEFVPLIENDTVQGGYSYIPITNNGTVQTATQNITREGWQTARANWTANVRAGRSSPEITATGALLYNHAVNSGDTRAALDILSDYQMAVRNSAQALQAARILKTLTPSDRLYMIRRSVDAMVADMNLRNPVTINEALAQRYQNAQTDQEADAVLDEIAQDVANQIPPTLMESFTALRYLNLLGNFKTQVINVAGNVGSKLVYGIKDKIGASMEILVNAITGGGIERSKALVTDRNTRRAAAQDYDNVRNWLMGNGRYDDRNPEFNDFAQRVQDRRRMLPVGLEQGRRATNWVMEAGDEMFARSAYTRALAGYLNANGIHTDDLNTVDPNLLDRAREYAVNQAREQTFRDNNQVSDFVSGIMRGRNTPTWARMLGEGIMPFRRTPANVLVRAEEYSPLGLINSTVNTIRAARGEISGADLVESWAKSMTGTALVAMGMALADFGVLSGGPDEDEEKAAFDELNGKQEYALTFTVDGETYSYTIDWATPAAMPLFMGAQLQKLFAEKDDLTWADYEKVLTAVGDPMIRMSMLQGVSDTLENVRHAENNLGQFLINAAMSYLTQGLTNTLLGQIERSTEKNRQTTYIDKESSVPVWIQRAMGKASQKIPGWDYQQTDYLNAFGETEQNEGGDTVAGRALYNMFSPGYLSKEKQTKVADELYRLRETTGENVFPQNADKTVNYTSTDGVRHNDYNLSAEEFDKMQRAEGQTASRLMSAIMTGNPDYEKLTDKQKTMVLEDIYAYSREQGRKAALPEYYSDADDWMRKLGSDEANGIIQHAVLRSVDNAVAAALSNIKTGWNVTSAAKQEMNETYAAFQGMTARNKTEIIDDASGDSARFLEVRENGISTDKYLMAINQINKTPGTGTVDPETGKRRMRDIDERAAIAKTGGMTAKEKDILMKAYMPDYDPKSASPDKTELKYDYAREEIGMTPLEYTNAYRIQLDGGKKAEKIQAWIDMGCTKEEANILYRLFAATGKTKIDVVDWAKNN